MSENDWREIVADLPMRRGARPRTTPRNPHMQLEQNATAPLWSELCRLAFGLPNVEERPSRVSVPGARALWLREGVPAGPAEAFMVGREFAHVHPLPEGSMHLALPREVAANAIVKRWAEPHPVARMGLVPDTVVMLFGARDTAELDVIWALVQASHRFASPVSDE